MSAFINDVKFVSTTSGVADFTIPAVAVSGFQLPIVAADFISGIVYSYSARIGAEFESGSGVCDGTTVARTTVVDGSDGAGIKVNFSTAPTVVITLLRDDVRELLTSDRTFYVDNTTGSNSNPGTLTDPFETLQYAWEHLSGSLDLAQHILSITLAASATSYSLAAGNGWVGGLGIFISGDSSATTTIDLAFFDQFILGPPFVGLDKATINRVSTYCVGTIYIQTLGSDVVLGGTAGIDVCYVDGAGANLWVSADTVADADYVSLYKAANGAHLFVAGTTTLAGTPDFTEAVAVAFDDSLIANPAAFTISGVGATGKRFDVSSNAIIDITGGALDFFPGDEAGVISDDGIYSGFFDKTGTQSVATTGASHTVDYSIGAYTILSLGHNVTTFAVSNWHPNGTSRLTLEVRNTGAFNITFPTGWLAVGGAAPTITSGAGKKDVIVLTSEDAGTTVYIHTVGQDFIAI